ncbi:MAG: PIN domain-containing protein, partial [Phormidesmis sp.]
MRYLLDTNVCVRFLNGRSAAVRDRLLATATEDIAVCSVVKAELFYGAMRSANPS